MQYPIKTVVDNHTKMPSFDNLLCLHNDTNHILISRDQECHLRRRVSSLDNNRPHIITSFLVMLIVAAITVGELKIDHKIKANWMFNAVCYFILMLTLHFVIHCKPFCTVVAYWVIKSDLLIALFYFKSQLATQATINCLPSYHWLLIDYIFITHWLSFNHLFFSTMKRVW